MTAYTTLAGFRSRLQGDQTVTPGTWDQAIIDAIAQVSGTIDEEVRQLRGQPPGWSFLAAQEYGVQLVSISPAGIATAGTFTLTFGASTTSALAYGAASSAVQAALVAILGAGTVAVAGAPGGPWTITFAGTLSGPQPVLVATSSLTPATAHAVVEELVTGSANSEVRRYTGRGTRLLLIDDCVSVSAVSILDPSGNVSQVLTAGTDYLTHPYQGTPITGLELTHGWWPTYPGGVSVTLRPGFGLTIPAAVTLATDQETVRSLRGAQAGEDDRLGVTPYGSTVTSKALLSSTYRLINRYRYGASILRAGG